MFHINYWSCSKVADKIRGTKKPYAKTCRGWREWKKVAKVAHPFRYWVADTALDKIQDFLYWPFNKIMDMKYYINNRFITKSHALTATSEHLKRGQWHDIDGRFMYCLFDELVNFVEIESAWMQVCWSPEDQKKYRLSFWNRFKLFRFRTWRCPEAGIDHLIWASKLTYGDNDGVDSTHKLYGKFTEQAKNAQWILSAYDWYTNVYLKRPDPMDISGWSVYCDKKRDKGIGIGDDDETASEKKESWKILKKLQKIEAQYEKEETKWLKELIEHRHSLWT